MVHEAEFIVTAMHEQCLPIGTAMQISDLLPLCLRLPQDEGAAAARPGDLESMLVSVAVPIVVVGVIVVEPGEIERLPAKPFVEDKLPALDGALAPGVGHAESGPGKELIVVHEIGPGNGSPRTVLLKFKEKLGVAAGIAVRIEE